MSPYRYVQLFLFGLFSTSAISGETATCTSLRPQSNVDLTKVYGDWFLGKAYGPSTLSEDKSKCNTISVNRVNETTLEVAATYSGQQRGKAFTIENVENPGTWNVAGENRTVEVIYLSADGTVMGLSSCMLHHTEHIFILLSKQLPISPEKIQEVLHAMEQAGMPEERHNFLWESEASCPST